MKKIELFAIVSLVSGALIVLGAWIGSFFGKAGIYGGAAILGYPGIHLGVVLARLYGSIEQWQTWRVTLAAVCGFGLVESVARYTLPHPLYAALSLGLVGLGAVVGAVIGKPKGGKSGE